MRRAREGEGAPVGRAVVSPPLLRRAHAPTPTPPTPPAPRRSAAHLLSDIAGFLISVVAIWVASRPATATATWGYHRIEVFGAMASILIIWLLTGVLCYEAVLRIITPTPVEGRIMFGTALAGVFVNLGMMWVLSATGHGHSHGLSQQHGHSHGGGEGGGSEEVDFNVRAAFIHVLGDTVQSVGVVIAGAVIWAVPAAHIADPICTFTFSALVLYTTINILRDCFAVLLNATPPGFPIARLADALYAIPGVSNVHDVHVWAFGGNGRIALTAHLIVDGPPELALASAQAVAADFGVKHSTLQVERCATEDVRLCADANAHTAECDILLAPAASTSKKAAGGGHGHAHGGAGAGEHGHAHAHGAGAGAGAAAPAAGGCRRLARPGAGGENAKHLGLDGVVHDIEPPRARARGLARATSAPAAGAGGGPRARTTAGGGAGDDAEAEGGAPHAHGGPAHGHSHGEHSHAEHAAHGHGHGAEAAAPPATVVAVDAEEGLHGHDGDNGHHDHHGHDDHHGHSHA